MDTCWYALHTKPHKERVVYQQLITQKIRIFYPCVPNRKLKNSIQPYFPGYLFVHVDLDEYGINMFQWLPFAKGLVCYGEEPAPVPEALIMSLHHRLREISAARDGYQTHVTPGTPVKIINGPFAGYEALFDSRLSGNERARVLLRLLGDRHLPLELSAAQIKPY